MGITTTKYVRKPLYVDAVQVTAENLAELSTWCQGEVKDYNDKLLDAGNVGNLALERYIAVRVHNPKNVRQTKAFVGDWILYTERGYKVYTQKAFKSSFDLANGTTQDAAVQAEKAQQAGQDETPPQAA